MLLILYIIGCLVSVAFVVAIITYIAISESEDITVSPDDMGAIIFIITIVSLTSWLAVIAMASSVLTYKIKTRNKNKKEQSI